jgi:hypothetical protein
MGQTSAPTPAPSTPTSTPTSAPEQKPITSKIEKGSLVKIAEGAVYTTGKPVPSEIRKLEWIVERVNGNRVVINKSVDGKYAIMSAVDMKYLSLVGAPA